MKVKEQEIIDAINSSCSLRDAASKVPVNYKTFRKYAIKLGVYFINQSGKGINKPRSKIKLEDILKGLHPSYQTHKLKLRLIKELEWEHICSICKNTEWNDELIPLELDHIDGDSYNHKENNIRFLCPNCHAQTSNYRSKNKIKRNQT